MTKKLIIAAIIIAAGYFFYKKFMASTLEPYFKEKGSKVDLLGVRSSVSEKDLGSGE